MTLIRSRQHPFVARCRQLARRRPVESGDVLLDGVHLVREAVAAGLAGLTVAVTAPARERSEVREALALVEAAGGQTLDVTSDVMDAASPVKSPTGVVGIGQMRPASLGDVLGRPQALIVVAVGVQDPGNVGAIVRSAEAAGASGFVVAGDSADPFGWRALRGSMGSTFRLPVAVTDSAATAVAAARALGVTTMATAGAAGGDLFATDLRRPVMILMGGEGPGLDPLTVEACDERIRIPMDPRVESLNVAVAAGVILFEARRQRVAGAGR